MATMLKSSCRGVRYREHKTRKHGIRPDRCFFIRYKVDGKGKEESVGWSSEGMTAAKASELLAVLKGNIRSGMRPQSLAEMRAMAEAEQAEQARLARIASRTSITVDAFMEAEYWPLSERTKRERSTIEERGLYRRELQKPFGELMLKEITPRMVERVIADVQGRGKSISTMTHILALLRQIWNLAVDRGIVQGDAPTRGIKLPKKDNRRMRFLSEHEARRLLEALQSRSPDTYDAAILSLFAGLRSGEIHALTWGDVNLDAGTLYIRDPKNKVSRHAHITPEIREVLLRRSSAGVSKQGYVIPSTSGGLRRWVSDSFCRTVEALGFNDGIEDARQRVVFHTLRHTFASWLVQRGVPLYTVAELMGHSTLDMTKRYAHLAPDTMRAAAMGLSGILDVKHATVIPFATRAQ